jgi:YrbI family 3-deoxy-D-manno-octulosonate 8-phosphate phosphatase
MEKSNKTLQDKASKISFVFTDVDGTLTDGTSFYSAEGEVSKQFSLRDGTGFYLLRQVGITAGIITGENSPFVTARAKKLNIAHCYLGVTNKLEILKDVCEQEHITLDEIAYIGDDLNDLCLLGNVGLFFCPADSCKQVVAESDYVCAHPGGRGAFREAVEMLLQWKNIDIRDCFYKNR